MNNTIITYIKKYWIYIFVVLFFVKCTQNCSNKSDVFYQKIEIQKKDSIINNQKNKIIQDSLIIFNQNSKIVSLEESLRIFDKAYDAQIKQQESNNNSQKVVNALIKKVDKIDKTITSNTQNETK